MLSNTEKGKIAENIACKYIEDKNYLILERNYRTRRGEIDIIAKNNNYIVFIEVKYRKDTENGYPRESVTKLKQNKIKKTAVNYIVRNNIINANFRFDVIEILGNNIEHIENAFW